MSASPSPEAPTAPEHVAPHRRTALVGARILGWAVYAYLVVTEVVLLLGFILLLFGANANAGFVQWAYRSLDRAMEPFRGIFSAIELGETGNQVESVLDTSILFAMLVYGLLALAVRAGLDGLTGRLVRLDRMDQQAWAAEQRQRAWQAEQQRLQAEQQRFLAEQQRIQAEQLRLQAQATTQPSAPGAQAPTPGPVPPPAGPPPA
ncbi:YggT family protein [Brachybacterium sp. YJGR34]|uniref:YggT family protein n=1 Tax=Brachybacterium sp. YJGR34 TaxID=2059911 RepID=UPI000E0BEBCB|nr:YggT family protein [Brachybacterium sp. YJGR34]